MKFTRHYSILLALLPLSLALVSGCRKSNPQPDTNAIACSAEFIECKARNEELERRLNDLQQGGLTPPPDYPDYQNTPPPDSNFSYSSPDVQMQPLTFDSNTYTTSPNDYYTNSAIQPTQNYDFSADPFATSAFSMPISQNPSVDSNYSYDESTTVNIVDSFPGAYTPNLDEDRIRSIASKQKPQVTPAKSSSSTPKKAPTSKMETLEKKHIRVPNVTTRQVQVALKNAGGSPGLIDGKMGAQTIGAIQEFQRKNKLQVDGIVGQQTWKILRPYYK